MAVTGWYSPGTLADDSGIGTATWFLPGNAASQNDTYASVATVADVVTHYLKATNFGIAIPTDATILGIEVEIDGYSDSTSAGWTTAQLVQGGSVAGNNLGAGDMPGADTDAYAAFGGASELWELSHDETSVESSGFGFALSSSIVGFGTTYVDHMRMRVYYTEVGSGAVPQPCWFM